MAHGLTLCTQREYRKYRDTDLCTYCSDKLYFVRIRRQSHTPVCNQCKDRRSTPVGTCRSRRRFVLCKRRWLRTVTDCKDSVDVPWSSLKIRNPVYFTILGMLLHSKKSGKFSALTLLQCATGERVSGIATFAITLGHVVNGRAGGMQTA